MRSLPNHPGLAAQLKSVITDKQSSVAARRLALLIAEKCRLTDLQPQLLQVALEDQSDHPNIRALAVSALKYCGDASVPALIRPLATGEGGPDPRDEIKGNALDLLWPGHFCSESKDLLEARLHRGVARNEIFAPVEESRAAIDAAIVVIGADPGGIALRPHAEPAEDDRGEARRKGDPPELVGRLLVLARASR